MRLLTIIATFLVGLLLSLSAFAQSGADPAVTSRNLTPAPLPNQVGAPFTLAFSIGNNGPVPISGAGTGNAERMQFGICLGKCAPNPASAAALSGELLTYFDVVYNANSNCFEGRQKQDVQIGPTSIYSLSIAAVVTSLSSSTTTNDIGASCNIAPNGSSKPQATDNDFASIYTHTEGPLPVSLVDFGVKAQADRSVLVSWQTSWERANQGYVIERSKDLVSFEEAGRVTDVAGNSSSLSRYEFVDKSPYRGRSYYRLRQVDLDGSSHNYPAQWVEIDARYGVYPNPVVGARFTLELDEPVTAQLRLYDNRGVEQNLNRSVLSEASTQLSSPSPLTSGVYVLRVEERGHTRQHRLIVP